MIVYPSDLPPGITEKQFAEIMARAPAARAPKAPGGGADEKLGRERLRSLMARYPNDLTVTREDWVAAGHGLAGMCEDDEEGFDVFDEWSREWEGGYDAGETRRFWDSIDRANLRATGGALKQRIAEIDPEGFAAWQAEGVFDDGAPPPPTLTPKAKKTAARGRARSRAEAQEARWGVRFHRGEKNEILKSMENAKRGIVGLGLTCRHDQFHHRMFVEGPLGRLYTGRLNDYVVLKIRELFATTYGKDMGTVHTYDAIVAMALGNGFNPVTDMLAEAELFWDGVPRLDRLGPDYFHSDDTALARACFRKTMIAAVRRARRPGVKFDTILVTESPEGWNKSTAWAVLAGEGNFSDAEILGKDARQVQEELADIWIHENADLSGMRKADIDRLKAFASRQVDRARPAYGRELIDQPRQSIEVGTTNASVYLQSQTGNRRFWPFRLNAAVDLPALKRDRLALWGEAAAAETAGESLVLDPKLWASAGVEQERRRVLDFWEEELENIEPIVGTAPSGRAIIHQLAGKDFVSSLSITEFLGGFRRYNMPPGSWQRVATVMSNLGWEKDQVKLNGKSTRGYSRPSVPHRPTASARSGTEIF